MDGTVILIRGNIFPVDRSGRGQQCFAAGFALLGGDYDLNGAFQQGIAAICTPVSV